MMKRIILLLGSALALCCLLVSAYALLRSYAPMPLAEKDFPLARRWNKELAQQIIEISGSGDDNLILARTSGALYAITAGTGDVEWFHSLAPQPETSPALAADGKVYVTDGEGLWALDQESGRALWNQSLPSIRGRVVGASHDIVLVNQISDDIRAYDAHSGNLLWTRPAGLGTTNTYIDGKLVYIPDRGVSAVDALTGNVVWTENSDVIGHSAYDEGVIYGLYGNQVAAFDTGARRELCTLIYLSQESSISRSIKTTFWSKPLITCMRSIRITGS